MSNEQRQFLSLPRYPGLISLLEACWLLGLLEHQGKILVQKGLLVPAGKRRRPRKARMFISAYILELAHPGFASGGTELSKAWAVSANAAITSCLSLSSTRIVTGVSGPLKFGRITSSPW